MKRQIKLQNKQIDYTLRKSRRARRMRLAVYCDGSVVLTTPFTLEETIAEKFVREKTEWLFSKLSFFEKYKNNPLSRLSNKDYVAHKENALGLIKSKVEYFANKYNFSYNKITIKNQKTCWGSCSKYGNLNFNYKIQFLPEEVQDYIVVHELCHLKQFDHSNKFWNLVSEIIPDHKVIKKRLILFIK